MKNLLCIVISIAALMLPLSSSARQTATNSRVLCSCHCKGSNSENIKIFEAPGGDSKQCPGMTGTKCITPVTDPVGGKLTDCVGVVGAGGVPIPRSDIRAPGANVKLQ